jgi:ATP-dependent RNA helicase DDX52/ROK1
MVIAGRIANVLLQSGSTVPEWILKLPKPSKMKRRQMGKVKRGEEVSSVVKIGRSQAQKKRYVYASIMCAIVDHSY